MLTADDVRALLLNECKKYGSQRSWAEKHGVSSAYVSDVLMSKRDPGELILAALNLRRIVIYESVI